MAFLLPVLPVVRNSLAPSPLKTLPGVTAPSASPPPLLASLLASDSVCFCDCILNTLIKFSYLGCLKTSSL
ncbi:GSCOCG00000792001-RA-CDS [Cotesia congregata]|nr:GSCOCG00000792001-RA-CDS [Cotesia congregata]